MALTRAKKEQVVSDVGALLSTSKLTVIAKYQGTSVKSMQALRRQARDSGTLVKVVKNRLVIQALKQHGQFKDIDMTPLEGMLAYAFNHDDEAAPAQSLASFAKTNPTLEFVGGLSSDGTWLSAEQVKSLAELPSKPVLIGSVITLISSPIQSVLSTASGQLSGIISALESKAS